MAVNCTRRVTGKVTSLAVTRDGAKVKATWKIPAAMTSDSRSDRAEWLDGEVDFEREGVPSKSSGEIWYTGAQYAPAGSKFLDYTGYDYNWIKGIALNTSLEKPYDRTRFHPLSPGKYCRKISVGIHGGNSSGVGGWDEHSLTASGRGPIAWATYTLKAPRKPSVSWAYDPATARATVTVETDAGRDACERYDTMVMVTVRRQDGTEETNLKWTATTSTEWTRTVDLSGYITNLVQGKYVTVTCRAYARGMAGDSAEASAQRTVALPVAATIGAVTCDRKAATGRVMVTVTPGKWTQGVQLQRRHGESGSWEDVAGAADDGNAKALYDSYDAADPADGEYVYYRVKSTRDEYAVYSAAKRADCLYTAKAPLTCGATVGVVSAVPSPSGTSAVVVMGYTDTTDNDGTELSWSDDPAAWNSTDGPQTAVFSGDDAQSASSAHAKTRTATLSGLAAGTTYYARARRVRTVDGETAYSGYSDTFAFRPAGAEDDSCAIVSATPAADGLGVEIIVGIDEDSPNTGTELSFSSYEHAWESNAQPESLLATWAADPASRSADWPATQTIYLTGLAAGTTYYAKARRYLEGQSSTTYGEWSEAAAFQLPAGGASADVRCAIVSCEPGEDGRSAVVTVGWEGQHSGTEVSWSDDPNAWESTEQPQSATFDWSDAESASAAWAHTSTIRLAGLSEGTTYYVRARCWYDGAATAWSAYTAHETVTPVSAPASVALNAPAAVARGEAIACSWTVEGDVPQVEWSIHESGSPMTSIAEGTGSLCRASIAPERYGDASSVSFYVEAGCGGGVTASNAVTVGIADRPELEVDVDQTIAAQPASFRALCSDPNATLLVTVRSAGISVQAPDGDRSQFEGDAVWTAAVSPAWEASGGAWAAEVEIPECELWDGGTYTIEARAVEPVAGLASDLTETRFAVEYAHQAQEPSSRGIRLEPDAEALSVTVKLAAPDGAAEGDCYDLYRKTPWGHVLVAEGLALDAEVLDPYAPFGRSAELWYRVCLRTPDGDFEFADFGYQMDGPGLRIDFDGVSVELPYNGEPHESYAPARESRQHADGEVAGYYEAAVEMTGSYDSLIVKGADQDLLDSVRLLGDHAGPCYLRARDGMAMQCGVEVSDLGQSYASPNAADVRISFSREAMTAEFAVQGGEGAGA